MTKTWQLECWWVKLTLLCSILEKHFSSVNRDCIMRLRWNIGGMHRSSLTISCRWVSKFGQLLKKIVVGCRKAGETVKNSSAGVGNFKKLQIILMFASTLWSCARGYWIIYGSVITGYWITSRDIFNWVAPWTYKSRNLMPYPEELQY